MFKWNLPNQKGTNLWPQTTRQPTKVAIQGIDPNSTLARAAVHKFRNQINHFQRSQQQNYALGTHESVKVRRFYPVQIGSISGSGRNERLVVPGQSQSEITSQGSGQAAGSGLYMTYTNYMGNERIDIAVSGALLDELQEELMIKPERDIELRGYIAVHNPNRPDPTEAAGEPTKLWQLALNGNFVDTPRAVGVGEAVIYCVDGYRPIYPSWNDTSNSFGAIGGPSPPHPHGADARQVQYPMFGINASNPTMIDYLAGDIVAQDIILDTPANITLVDIQSEGVLDLLGDNTCEVFEVPFDPEEGSAYALVYAEFFGRYCREVDVSWRFPYKEIGGVTRKILINDDPMFRGDEISGVGGPLLGTVRGVGDLRLDLRPPTAYRDPNGDLYSGPSAQDLHPTNPDITLAVEGYPISLFDPWP